MDENSEKVVLSGTGVAGKEFLNVEDLSIALLSLTDKWDNPEINIGGGDDISIREQAAIIAKKPVILGKLIGILQSTMVC